MERFPLGARTVYRPELDAVRLFAFLLVFVHHNMNGQETDHQGSKYELLAMTVARISAFGLPLFFVLSGYLISDLLLREKMEFGSVDTTAFLKRRILRIWPLTIFGLSIGWLLSWHTGHPATAAFLSYFFLIGNVYTAKFGFPDNPMTPLWSLSIEGQFYLIWSVIAKFCSKRGMFIACAGMVSLANASLVYLSLTRQSLDTAIWCNTFVQFEMFAAGILLALKLCQKGPSLPLKARGSLFGGALLCWVVSAQYCKPVNAQEAISPLHLVAGYLLIAWGSVFVLLSVLGVPPETVPKPIRYLGRISFGLYVYHELAMEIVNFAMAGREGVWVHLFAKALGLGLTLAFAALSYQFLETPFLKRKRGLERIKTGAI